MSLSRRELLTLWKRQKENNTPHMFFSIFPFFSLCLHFLRDHSTPAIKSTFKPQLPKNTHITSPTAQSLRKQKVDRPPTRTVPSLSTTVPHTFEHREQVNQKISQLQAPIKKVIQKAKPALPPRTLKSLVTAKHEEPKQIPTANNRPSQSVKKNNIKPQTKRATPSSTSNTSELPGYMRPRDTTIRTREVVKAAPKPRQREKRIECGRNANVRGDGGRYNRGSGISLNMSQKRRGGSEKMKGVLEDERELRKDEDIMRMIDEMTAYVSILLFYHCLFFYSSILLFFYYFSIIYYIIIY